jgi:hypothetical protein
MDEDLCRNAAEFSEAHVAAIDALKVKKGRKREKHTDGAFFPMLDAVASRILVVLWLVLSRSPLTLRPPTRRPGIG